MCFLGEFEWFWLISRGGDCEIWESWGFKWYVNDFSRIQMIANDCQWINFEIVVNIFFVILRNRGSAIFSGWKKVNPVGKSTSRCFAGCHYYNIYIYITMCQWKPRSLDDCARGSRFLEFRSQEWVPWLNCSEIVRVCSKMFLHWNHGSWDWTPAAGVV